MRAARVGPVVCAAALVVALPPGVAGAHRNPTRAERTAITDAVKMSKLTAAVPAREYTVSQIRVSTANTSYASGQVVGLPGYRDAVQTAYVVVRKRGRRWTLIDIGGELDCKKDAPRAVTQDLRLPCE